jgi:hypothetical protein
MRSLMLSLLLPVLAAIWSMPAFAAEVAVEGDAIQSVAMKTAIVIDGEDVKLSADGTATFGKGGDARKGNWAVRADRLCLVDPAKQLASCYTVFLDQKPSGGGKTQLVLQGSDGARSTAAVADTQ